MEHAWYSKNSKEVFEILKSSAKGLTFDEAKRRLDSYGSNRLPEAKFDSIFVIFLRQFQSPLIYILLLASLVVLLMNELVDGFIILFVLLFNAVVGTIQEGKAQNTLLALKKFSETSAKVLRAGRELVIPDYEVVPGDIIVLHEGDKIPADARIIHASIIRVDESALTGESFPVNKFSNLLASNLPTAEQKNMVFKGTHIVAGSGLGIVVATGLDTVLGKISKEIAFYNTEIPLKANIRYLSHLIILTVLSISTLLFFLGIALGHSVKEMFATVVSLSVSIIPEGLPIVMTLVLATGVWRMTKRNALVRNLQAIEALGQASVIAVDKTGTITKNEIVLQKIYINEKAFDIKGIDYTPYGEVILKGEKISPLGDSDLVLAGKFAALGSGHGIVLDESTHQWRAVGDPTDAALMSFVQKLGLVKSKLEKEFPKLSEIPFDYKRKYHAVTHKNGWKVVLTVIGAPEVILDLSTSIWRSSRSVAMNPERKNALVSILNSMSEEGLRVLAFASKSNVSPDLKSKEITNLTFTGFFGLKDALRPEVSEAIKKAVSAGIKVVMITGDHKITAQSIAYEAGIYKSGDTILTGENIDSLSDEELVGVLDQVTVFARVTPEHKLKIVNAYKKKGEIVAMTGDGVNDAPSLVAADLGISMGKIGTEVAKEASDIVLLDDNFASIVSAIEEGRNIYKTIQRVILYLFSTSIGEALTIIGALLFGYPLPIIAAQIVWLNLVTDGFLDVSLAMEPKEEGLLRRNFERSKKYILDSLSVKRMFLMAMPMVVGTLYLFHSYYQYDLVKAWTVVLTVLAVFQWFNVWNCRHESKSILQMNPFSNKFLVGATAIVIILQLLAIYNPLMQKLLRTTALDLSDWLIIIPVASSIIIVEEIRKFTARIFASGFKKPI